MEYKIIQNLKSSLLLSLFIIGSVIILSSTEIQASQIDTSQKEIQPGQKKTIAGSGKSRFDWFGNVSKTNSAKIIKTSNTPSLGNGSWICSAAGFGKQSRCYKRQ